MRLAGISDEIADAPTEHDVEHVRYIVWPENIRTLNLFRELETQWDYVAEADGERNRTRLRWESLEILLRNTNGIPRRDHTKIHAEIRVMEKAALIAMTDECNKRREQRRLEAEQKRLS